MNTYQQHPLSVIFPELSSQEVEARLDGELPTNELFIGKVMASDWFHALQKSQRAMYVAGWFHHHATGSNQHKAVRSKISNRYCAEAAATLLQKVAA